MNRVLWTIVVSALSVAPVVADHWPQFRGTQGGLAPDNPSLPASWSRTQNVVWKLDVPGRSWSSPVVWGDHVFVTTVVNVDTPVQALKPVPEYRGRSWNGPLDETSIATTADTHRWVLYDVDFRSGRIRWERDAAHGRSVSARPSEEHLLLRDAGHGRRARVRVLRQHWTVRLRHVGRAGLVEADAAR